MFCGLTLGLVRSCSQVLLCFAADELAAVHRSGELLRITITTAMTTTSDFIQDASFRWEAGEVSGNTN